jgi:hypothetical protein
MRRVIINVAVAINEIAVDHRVTVRHGYGCRACGTAGISIIASVIPGIAAVRSDKTSGWTILSNMMARVSVRSHCGVMRRVIINVAVAINEIAVDRWIAISHRNGVGISSRHQT